MKVEHISDFEPKAGEDVTRKELWLVEENKNDWKFICQTLYTLPVNVGAEHQQVNCSFTVNFNEIWKTFGINLHELKRSEQLMICNFILNSLKLTTPTIKEGKVKKSD